MAAALAAGALDPGILARLAGGDLGGSFGKYLSLSEIINYANVSPKFAVQLLGNDVEKTLNCLDQAFPSKVGLIEEYLKPDVKRIYAIAAHLWAIDLSIATVVMTPMCQLAKDLAQKVLEISSRESWNLDGDEALKWDQDFIHLLCRKDPFKFAESNPESKLGALFALQAAKLRAPEVISKLCLALKDDDEIANIACDLSPHSFQHLSDRLRANRTLAGSVLSRRGMLLEFASDDIKDDEALVVLALVNSGYALQYASARLRNERAIVVQAVRTSPLALQYAAPSLLIDEELLDLHLNQERY